MRKQKTSNYDLKSRLVALVMAAMMLLTGMPTTAYAAQADDTPAGGTIVTVADPETLTRPTLIYGQDTENAGKITVGKSVSDTSVSLENNVTITPAENNFLVTLSQTAQVMGLASKLPVPIDAVFVLDTSGSMANSVNGTARYISMINAANDAINTLLAANEHNRVAVVAFSSKGDYGEGTSDGEAANVLSELAHYDGEAATKHLQRVNQSGEEDNNGIYVAGRKSVTAQRWVSTGKGSGYWEDYTVNAYRDAREGGTNIHAGIALGADLLMKADTTVQIADETVTRMPFLIVLSDGAPTYSSNAEDNANTNAVESYWHDVEDVLAASEQGQGNIAYEGNGFLPALTAAYYKGAITEHYFGAKASEDNRCAIYTIGIGLNTQSGGDGIDATDLVNLAQITMDPKNYANAQNGYFTYGNTSNQNYNKSTTHSFQTYWNNYVSGNDFDIRVNSNDTFTITKETIAATKDFVNGNYVDESGNLVNMYTGGLKYNDEYFASTGSAADLNATFSKLVRIIQLRAISSPTEIKTNADFDGYVHFYDPIGEYMEVKDVHGVVADGYHFQGASFAQNMVKFGTAERNEAFDKDVLNALNGRLHLSGSEMLTEAQVKSFVEAAVASGNQLYYNSPSDYNNSICWWGQSFTDEHGDQQMKFMGYAADDSAEYVEGSTAPSGADYVCRSYYYHGSAGGAIEPIDDFLVLSVRVQRQLTAPYQQTVYVSIPASLLSVERVLITEDKTQNPVTYTATVQSEPPVRLVYEVGLQDNINAQNVATMVADTYKNEVTADKSTGSVDNYDPATDTYYFYTNDWDRTKSIDSHERALAKTGFDAALDNAFYAYQEDTQLYDENRQPLTGDVVAGQTAYYKRVYYDWTGKTYNQTNNFYPCDVKTAWIKVTVPENISEALTKKSDGWYVNKGVYTASSLQVVGDDTVKSSNNTGTSTIVAHPIRTAVNDSHYTTFLGNNGRLALTADTTKTVDITKADASNTMITDADGTPVTIGDKLTYKIKVVNTESDASTAVVTDKVPAGTELVAGTISDGGAYDEATRVITWNLSLAKGETKEVTFAVIVTEDALNNEIITLDNTATIKLANSPAYQTNKTDNPPQGKTVEGADSSVNPEEGIKIGQELRYTIRWANNAGQTANVTITDVVPTGTTVLTDRISDGGTYDANTGKVTWKFEDVAAGASGLVNFVVVVNESAKTPIVNGATIQVGNNNPAFETNTTNIEVLSGDMSISKLVAGEGADEDKYFEVTLSTRGTQIAGHATLNGTYDVTGSSKVQSITFTDGKAVLEIKHGETITVKGLPAGIEITVVETGAPGYTAVYSDADQKVNVVTGSTPASMTITNNYAVEASSFTLTGKKTLNTAPGAYLGDTTFSFDIYPSDATGVVKGDVTNTGQATVSTLNNTATFNFAARTITGEGTWYYLVKEANTNITGITYDATQYLVKVTATDTGAGKLELATSITSRVGDSGEFTASADQIAFVNSYEPNEVSLNLAGEKNLAGRDLKANEFAFVVTENGSTVSTGTLAADGIITFAPITFYTAGEHTYKITEINNNEANITYDTKEYTLYVKVEDVNGQLTITKQTLDDSDVSDVHVTFNNAYVPSEVSVPLIGQKYYIDENSSPLALNGGEFTFEVDQIDDQGNVIHEDVSAGQNASDGKIAFTPITVKVKDGVTGDYTEKLYFKVSEAIPTVSKDPYMSYDTSVYTVEITVNYVYSSGTLTASVTGISGAGSAIEFTNIKYPDSITVQPQGFKTTNYSGGTLPNVSFSFAVKNVENGNTVYTGIAKGGTSEPIEFTKLTYTHTDTTTPAVYKYWIMESNTGNTNNGITYDTSWYLMTVTITNTDGKLDADVDYFSSAVAGSTNVADYTNPISAPTFTNEYDAKGSINITAAKNLTGGLTLTADQFAFRLQRMADLTGDATTGGVINGVNDATGKITFATLFYSLDDIPAGQGSTIIRYQMSEIIPTINPIPGVTYDKTVHDIFVKLTNDNNGGIIAELCDKDGNVTNTTDTGVTFHNSYAVVQGADVTITANKVLNGRDLVAGEFTFGLYYLDPANNNAERLVASTTNDAYGNVTFTRHYPATTATVPYHYVIRELNDGKGGIDYDETAINVQVTIKDENATLVGAVTYDGNEDTTFTNTYKSADVEFVPTATKNLTGRKLNANEFSYQIVNVDNPGTPVSIGQNDANGNITFSPIRYTDKPGTGSVAYKYAINEVVGTRGGVTYDTTTYYLLVTVTDVGEGALEATGKYYSDEACTTEAAVVFNNTYTTGNGTVTLEASKSLKNHEMEVAEFDFVVTDSDGNIVTTGDNDANGKVTFGTIGYTHSDLGGDTSKTFTYWMQELTPPGGKLNGITFDGNRYKVEVTVTDNGYGVLNTEVKYDGLEDGAVPSFTNIYEPAKASITLNATKRLTGKNLKAKEFTFVLTDKDNNTIEAKNDENGLVTFDLKDAFSNTGTYKYTLTEKKSVDSAIGGDGQYTFDNSVYEVIITVTDDGVGQLLASAEYVLNGSTVSSAGFTNNYKPKELEIDLSLEIGAVKTVTDENGQSVKITTAGGSVDYPLDGFKFAVTDALETEVSTGTSNAAGKIDFTKFTFTQAGEYRYWISEKATDKGGIAIDGQIWGLHIQVVNNYQTGKLEVASVTTYPVNSDAAAKAPEFVNIYTPAPVNITITANKELTGRNLREREFIFRLLEGENIRVESRNDASGNITFTFTENVIGEHTYTIVEVLPNVKEEGVTYDETTIGTVKVVVQDDGTGQLKVEGDAVFVKDSNVTFKNSYKVTRTNFAVKKTWNDAENQDGFRPTSVTIDLYKSYTPIIGSAVRELAATVVLNAENNWYHEFTNLPLYADASLTIPVTYSVTEEKVANYVTTYENVSDTYTDVVNTHTPEETSVSVTKVWDDENNQDGRRPVSIDVQLLADGIVKETVTLNEANSWKYKWENLPVYADGKAIVYTVEEIIDAETDAYYNTRITGSVADGFTITNTYTTEETEVSVKKVWDDENNQDGKRPASVRVQLLADGIVKETVTLNAANSWAHTWSNLDVFADGVVIKYTVKEITSTLPVGYTAEVTGDAANGYTLTNKYTPETVKITVNKVWDDNDNADGLRPQAITVHLLADGEHTGQTMELNETNSWSAEWTLLDKYVNGTLIDYTVLEELISAQAAASLYEMTDYKEDADALDANHHIVTITNTYMPETTSVTVNKVWHDANNQDGLRPASVDVTLQKSADGGVNWTDVNTVTLSAANKWMHTWTSLLVLDRGAEVDYQVVEKTVPTGYTANVVEDAYILNAFTVTNTHEPAVTEVSVEKVWKDADNQDGKRPTEITVQLLANNVVQETVTLDAANSWKHIWTDLDKFASGSEISYTVKEVNVADGYTAVITGTAANGYTITNNYTPEQTKVSVTKVWDDADNQDGKRPDYIEVQLLADGTVANTAYLYAGNNWTFTWEELDVYKAGQEIIYTVNEVMDTETAAIYSSVMTGSASEGFTITNSYETEKVTFTAKKVWDDADNQDNIRPVYVTVVLYADGESTGSAAILRDSNNWTYTWNNLDKYSAGKEITYTVVERAVSGYTTDISVNGNIATVTNSYTPETTEISVEKVWSDANNQDGKRPASVTVELLADGHSTGKTVTLNESNSWSYTWTDLAKNKAGTAIAYTVEETNVPTGYTRVISGSAAAGYTITNYYTPEKITIAAHKVWNDDYNNDGQRPDSVTLHLIAGDAHTGETRVLNSQSMWTAKWENLDKYKDGKEIVYSIYEEKLEAKDGKYYSTTYDRTVDAAGNVSVTVTNARTDNKIAVAVEKLWDDANNQDGIRPDKITVTITGKIKVGTAAEQVVYTETKDITENAGLWRTTFTELPEYEAGEKVIYSIEEAAINGYSVNINKEPNIFLFEITNKHVPDATSVSIEKIWNDNSDQDGKRPDSIQVQLLADGIVKETVTLNESNSWVYTWTGLDVNKAGKAIAYTVKEVMDAQTAAEYTAVVTGDAANGFIITNTHEIEKRNVSVEKVWKDADNQDGYRPVSVTVQLKANGVAQGAAVTLDDSNNWAHIWKNLDVYADGKEITYTVEEAAVAEYTADVTGNVETGFTITNTHEVDKTEVTVTKVWDDNNDQDGFRPEMITVELLADGTIYGAPVVLNETNNWTYTWTELEVNAAGKVADPIEYTVAEIDDFNVSKHYTAVVNGDAKAGYTITNTHTPEKVDISVEKAWDDANNQDGFRPTSIRVQLLANKTVIDTVTLDESNDWKYVWKDSEALDKYADGKAIEYTVKEVMNAVTAEKYIAVVSETVMYSFTITNTHEAEQLTIGVEKKWTDDNNRDGVRPGSIKVQLTANGLEIGPEVELSEATGWKYTWPDTFDKYANGKLIDYTVVETEVPAGYNTPVITVADPDASNKQITVENTHEPETTSITVNKVWDDDNDIDEIRPDSIEVQLKANGVNCGAAVVLSKADNWTYTWTNLPKYTAGMVGVPVEYTVEELTIMDAYEATITADATGTEFTIVNFHEPETDDRYAEFFVTKNWVDDNNASGKRPDSIIVHAYQNGVFVTALELNEDNNWTAHAVWLVYRDGVDYIWTIEEVNVPEGYSVSYDQATLTVTNTLGGTPGGRVPSPNTGDDSNLPLFVATGSVSMIAIAVYLILRRRKKEEA